MILATVGHTFQYELEKLCRVFLPFEKIVFSTTRTETPPAAVTTCRQDAQGTQLSAELFFGDRRLCETARLPADTREPEQEAERLLAVLLFRCFVALTGYRPAWGILTGVRPSKLFSRLSADGGADGAAAYFADRLLVSEEKIDLCRVTSRAQEEILSLSRPRSFSLYLSVPFCPTRCAYCSFVSHSIDRAGKLIDPYVDRLCDELRQTGKIARDLGLRLETVYIGGGTPTTLSAAQLTRVMRTVRAHFDLSTAREYTVEAGRPDTVTAEKLEAILAGGATRVSINPQTMNDAVLARIGRRHSSQQTVDAFRLARSVGCRDINMDLIAGLPGDEPDSFRDSLTRVLSLDPENVTVHALSVKRASRLSTAGELPELDAGRDAAEMTEYARRTLTTAGFSPYYLYRQSKTVGNLENVGYAKPGHAGLYNVYIMEETHTILACGASAVTKLREPGGDRITRIFNFKYPYEYLSRFEEICARKAGIYAFYAPDGAGDQPGTDR